MDIYNNIRYIRAINPETDMEGVIFTDDLYSPPRDCFPVGFKITTDTVLLNYELPELFPVDSVLMRDY